MRKEFKFYPGGKVQYLADAPGSLRISGWNKASVLLEVEKVLYQVSPEEAKKLADQLVIQVRYGQTSANLRASGPQRSGAAYEINATLYVPKDRTDLNLQLLQGDLVIESVEGWVEASLKDGSIEVKPIAGYYSLATLEGDLNIEMKGRHWNGLGFSAVTQRGTVHLRLPVPYSASLQLETRDGNFTIEYPEQLVNGESIPLTVVQGKNVRSLTASVGEGGAPIRIHTGSGDVRLSVAP